jgi:carbamoyl-phosphate synthase large subunit
MTESANPWRVLVVPAGTEISLELARALQPCKEVTLFGAGRLENSPGPFRYRQIFAAPLVTELGFTDAICKIIYQNRISHVFAAHDDALLALSEIRDTLGATLVTSPPEVCRIARSKRQTIGLLRDAVPTPTIYDTPAAVPSYPVFVKPDAGQGSRGARLISSCDGLHNALREDPSCVIQEYLPGVEYTVDCFSDRARGLLYAEGRERFRVSGGITAHCHFETNPLFTEYAQCINRLLPFRGAWFFQLKADSHGTLKLLEASARIAGTSGISRVSGINLPLLSLYEAEGLNVSIRQALPGVTLDRAHTPLYRHALKYEAVYVDFDDALVIHGRLNTLLVRVLYQCVNRNIPVILVSRHDGDLRLALRKHKIEGLFDRVVHLRGGESKAIAIEHRFAVFIDDSFRELTELEKVSGIIAIHPSAVELLLCEYD